MGGGSRWRSKTRTVGLVYRFSLHGTASIWGDTVCGSSSPSEERQERPHFTRRRKCTSLWTFRFQRCVRVLGWKFRYIVPFERRECGVRES